MFISLRKKSAATKCAASNPNKGSLLFMKNKKNSFFFVKYYDRARIYKELQTHAFQREKNVGYQNKTTKC